MDRRIRIKYSVNGEEKTLETLSAFEYSAQRMGAAPTISATIRSFDKLPIDSSFWCVFVADDNTERNERFYVRNAPSILKDNTDARYKYDITFVSERDILDNVYFIDADESAHEEGVLVSKGLEFQFAGTLQKYVDKLNAAISLSALKGRFSVAIADAFKNDERVLADKFFSISRASFTTALQEIYNQYDIPYYFDDNRIMIGEFKPIENAPVLAYGKDDALVSISKKSASNKIITRCSGVGSSENLPLYYPNSSSTGDHDITYTPTSLSSAIKKLDLSKLVGITSVRDGATLTLYNKSVIADKANVRQIVYAPKDPLGTKVWSQDLNEIQTKIEEGSTLGSKDKAFNPFTVFANPNEQGNAILIYAPVIYKFYADKGVEITLTGKIKINHKPETRKIVDRVVTATYGPDDDNQTSIPLKKDGKFVDFYEFEVSYTMKQSGLQKMFINVVDTYEGSSDTATQLTSLNAEVRFNVTPAQTVQATDYIVVDGKDKNYSFGACGLELKAGSTFSDGDKITISPSHNWQQPQKTLMPSIYRATNGAERFYNAVNGGYTYSDDSGNSYQVSVGSNNFVNEFDENRFCEHIETFDDIKPTIKGAKYLNLNIDMFSQFDYDTNDSDEVIVDENKFKHPYFYAKLRKLGFNLFDHALEDGEMTFSFTSGECAPCNFTLVVDEDTKKNILQANASGVIKDAEGKAVFKEDKDIIERQNDTTNNEVWIALKKDNSTYGELMPNKTHKPKACSSNKNDGDTFVITNISMPTAYILNAEKELEERILTYMSQNNVSGYSFDVKFSKIFLEENRENFTNHINESSSLTLDYHDTAYQLFVNSFKYKVASEDALPEISVTISDALQIAKSGTSTLVSTVKNDVLAAVQNLDFAPIISKVALRRVADDSTQYALSAKRLSSETDIHAGNDLEVKGNAEITRDATIGGSAYIGGSNRVGGDVTIGDFSAVLGSLSGAQITKEGDASFKSIRANYLEVMSLIYNQIKASSAYTMFDDTASIADIEINEVDGVNIYTLTFDEKELTVKTPDGIGISPFVEHDIIRGYVNKIGEGDFSRAGECWMEIVQVPDSTNDLKSYQVKARLFTAAEDVEDNLEPNIQMTVAHWGNTVEPTRQNTCYVSSRDGNIVQLYGINHPKLYTADSGYGNYGVVVGRLPYGLWEYIHNAYSYVKEEDPILYAKYVAVEHLLQIDHLGLPIKTERFRGEWSEEEAKGNNPYRSLNAKDVTYYDTVTYDGSKWQCVIDKDQAAPNESIGNWDVMIRRGESATSPYSVEITNEFDSVGTYSNGNTDTKYDLETSVKLFQGTTELSIDDITATNAGNITATVDLDDNNKPTGKIVYSVAANTYVDERSVSTITIKKQGMSDKTITFTIAGVRAGDNGESAALYKLVPSTNEIIQDEDGVNRPETITFDVIKMVGGSASTITNDERDNLRVGVYVDEYFEGAQRYTNGAYATITTDGIKNGITAELYLQNKSSQLLDKESISVVKDGKTGPKGDDGLTPQANLLKNTNFDLFTASTDFAETSDLSEIISDYYGEKWVRFTRKSNRNHAAIVKILNGVYEPRYEAFDVNQDNCYWCFVGTPESFKIYNKFVGSSMALTSSISSGAKCSFVNYYSAINWTMDSSLNADGSRPIRTKDNTSLGINSYQGLQNGGELHLYKVTGDAGSQWFLGSKENQQLMYWEEQNGEITDFRDSNAFYGMFNNSVPNTLLSCTLPKLNSGNYSLSFFLMSSSTDTDIIIERANGSALPISIVSSRGTISNGQNYTKATIQACNDFTPIEINLNVTESIEDDIILRFSDRLRQGAIWIAKVKFEESVKATPYRLADSDMCSPVKSTVFKRVSSKPNKPEGGSYSQPVPSGWSDGIPAASDNINAIYSSTRTFYSGGYSTKWSEPQLLADSSVFDVCYCLKDTYTLDPPTTHPNGSNDDWQNSPSENAVWMATSTYTAGGTWSDWTITKIKGENGESPYIADLTNEMDSIALNSDGTAASADVDGREVKTTVSLFYGHEKQALSLSDVTIETPAAWGDNIVEKTLSNGNKDCNIKITVPAGIVIDARTEILITITKGTIVRELVLTINGVRGGENGEPAVLYQLIPSHNQIVKKKDGSTVPTAITFTAYKIEGAQRTNVTDQGIYTVMYSGGASGRDNVNKVSIPTSGVTTSIKAELIVSSSTVDSETIAVVFDGNDGDDGENGVTPEWNLLDNSAFQIDEEGDCEFWTLSSDATFVDEGVVNSLELDYDLYYSGSGYIEMATQRLVDKLKPLKWYVFSVEVTKSVTSGSLTVGFGGVGPIGDLIYVNGSRSSSTYSGSVSLANGHNEIVFETTEDFGNYGDEYLTFTVQARPDSKYCITKPKIELASDQVRPYQSKSTGWNYSVNDMSGTDGSSPQENLVLNSNFDIYESSELNFSNVSSSFDSIMSSAYGECWVRLKRYSKQDHYLYINSTENDTIPYYGPNPTSIDASLWCFVGTTSSFKIYNKYAGPSKAFRVERDGPDYPWWFAEVCDASDAGNWKFGSTANGAIAICSTGEGDTYINSFAGHENGGLSALFSLDDGSRWKVEVLGSRGLKFWDNEYGYVVENIYDGFNSYALTTIRGGGGISQITPNLELDTWYTLSFKLRSFNTSDAALYVTLGHEFAAGDVVTSSEFEPTIENGTTEVDFEALDSVWKTASVSFKLTSYPTKFNYTFRCTRDGGGAVFITQPKLERGKKATPYRKAETDLAGPAGDTGPMLYPQGTWAAGITYRSDSEKKPFVYHEGHYYVLEAAYSLGNNPANDNGSIWEQMDEIEYLFTKFLMASQARFGTNDGGVFYDNKLMSAKDTNGKYFGDTAWKSENANLSLDFKEGALVANNAMIRGTIYATDGEFSGSLKGATGTFSGTLEAAGGTFNGALIIKKDNKAWNQFLTDGSCVIGGGVITVNSDTTVTIGGFRATTSSLGLDSSTSGAKMYLCDKYIQFRNSSTTARFGSSTYASGLIPQMGYLESTGTSTTAKYGLTIKVSGGSAGNFAISSNAAIKSSSWVAGYGFSSVEVGGGYYTELYNLKAPNVWICKMSGYKADRTEYHAEVVLPTLSHMQTILGESSGNPFAFRMTVMTTVSSTNEYNYICGAAGTSRPAGTYPILYDNNGNDIQYLSLGRGDCIEVMIVHSGSEYYARILNRGT